MVPPAGRYAVLGASGLVGSHALLALREVEGVEVRAVCHTRSPRVGGRNIQVIRADLSDPQDCRAAVAGCDFVLIAAGVLATAPVLARDPVGPVLANLLIAVNCLEAAYHAGVAKCLWLSSTTGYPAGDGEMDESRMFEADPPGNWYAIGWTTRYLETLCQAYSERFARPMPVIVLRPTMIYGEYDHFDEETAHFLPSLVRRVVRREDPIEVWGTGEQTRDLIYAGDVVRAMLAALAKVDRFEAFNVAAGRSHSVNEVLGRILEIDGFTDARVVHLTDRPTSVSRRSFANAKAKAELDFTPATPLESGLRRTIEWYRGETLG